jgi:O-antigen ligase
VLLAVCALWLALIGARTAFGALVVFYVVIRAWPLITRNRFFFYGAFWGMVLLIVALNVVYMLYAGGERESIVEGSDWGILQKSIDTRTEIWVHLLYLIVQEPLFGYGTDQSTAAVGALPFLEFTFNRPNLSAHSTYYEVLYRLGLVGLAGFLIVLSFIWRCFWTGRTEWAVRIAGAFLLTMLFFSTTADNLIFSAQQLRNGFAWIALGIGAGACLRARKNARAAGIRPV